MATQNTLQQSSLEALRLEAIEAIRAGDLGHVTELTERMKEAEAILAKQARPKRDPQKAINFTKGALDAIPIPAPGKRETYHDTKTPGLQLRVTDTGSKTFVVRRRVRSGNAERVTLGTYPAMTPEQARRRATEVNAEIAQGISPTTEKKRIKLAARTLSEVLEEYIQVRGNLKASTVRDMHQALKEVCGEWLNKPLNKITPAMLEARHREHATRSMARANVAMRYLRALFNFAMVRYLDSDGNPLILVNPVLRLSRLKLWHRVEGKQTLIKPYELAAWWAGVEGLPDTAMRDYFKLLVLTGLRRNEALFLLWENVDLMSRSITIKNPKNHRDLNLPLSDYLFELLNRRKASAVSGYVFASIDGKLVVDTRWNQKAITRASGVSFSPHDCRRTFATIAESLDIPAYALKRLLNHASGDDVTAGYIVASVERLREPMQKITNYVLKAAGVRETASILRLKQG
ncbi:MAG: integrase family protein [Methylococcaceae bacterium]|nr:integrase family protein [Methylococcaceae bacterium]